MGALRKTKIVCTLGPASMTWEVIGQLMDNGMDVARFNCSHGTHESHKKTFDIVDELRREKDIPVATLLDTKGPEIRLGEFKGGKALLKDGDSFTLTTEQIIGDAQRVSITFAGLPGDVGTGTKILLDDGLIELTVVHVNGSEIECYIDHGGEISNRKGVNVPGVELSMPYVSDADRADIVFATETGFDFIAASFVRSAADVMEIRKLLHENGGDNILIISKIENAQGVENIDEILRVSDGIMVARGDMGVEIDFNLLPAIQKKLIRKAYGYGKMVITATQMLESMIKSPRPTRAETSDVANAIYDGTSALMLSGETASGLHPIRAVRAMAQIAMSAEEAIDYRERFENHRTNYEMENDDITNAISHATCTTAYDLGASAIITVSLSGRTARNISKYRPDIPIIGCTALPASYRQLALSWGVVPVMVNMEHDLDELFDHAVESARELGYVKSGDLVVLSTGVPLGMSGSTNLLKVHIAGDVLVRGEGIGTGKVVGRLCVGDADTLGRFHEGDILVIEKTGNDLMPIIKMAKAVITEEGGPNSHAAIAGSALDIPVIVGAANATKVLKNGTFAAVDAEQGFVSSYAFDHLAT